MASAERNRDVQEAIDAATTNAASRRLFAHRASELPTSSPCRPPVHRRLRHDHALELPHGHLFWKLLPAVVCGNTCVIKPAQDTPLSTFNLVQAHDAGIPKGVINIVTASARKSHAAD